MNSNLYKYWQKNKNNASQNIEEFIKQNKTLNEFTKYDILFLMNDQEYSRQFITLILEKNIAYLTKIFKAKELMSLFKKANLLTKKTILDIFIFDEPKYTKELHTILKKIAIKPNFYTYLPQLLILIQKNHTYSIYLKNQLFKYYLLFSNDHEKEEIVLNYIRENKKLMEYIILNIARDAFPKKEIPSLLKKLKKSIYYQELFEPYKEFIYSSFLKIPSVIETYDKQLYNALLLVLEDFLKMENTPIEKLTYLNSGFFSDTFKTKTMIIKTGNAHYLDEIMNSSSLAYPLFRKNFKEYNYYIELNHFTDTKDITEKDVYEIYKYERDHKRIWFDCKIDNLGKKISNNNSYNFNVEPSTLGLKGKIDEVKKIGEIKIIDLDYLMDENVDLNKMKNIIDLNDYYKLERIYQKELKKE